MAVLSWLLCPGLCYMDQVGMGCMDEDVQILRKVGLIRSVYTVVVRCGLERSCVTFRSSFEVLLWGRSEQLRAASHKHVSELCEFSLRLVFVRL